MKTFPTLHKVTPAISEVAGTKSSLLAVLKVPPLVVPIGMTAVLADVLSLSTFS